MQTNIIIATIKLIFIKKDLAFAFIADIYA